MDNHFKHQITPTVSTKHVKQMKYQYISGITANRFQVLIQKCSVSTQSI